MLQRIHRIGQSRLGGLKAYGHHGVLQKVVISEKLVLDFHDNLFDFSRVT